MRIRIRTVSILPYHFDMDPYSAFHVDADPDPAFQFDADPDQQHWFCTYLSMF